MSSQFDHCPKCKKPMLGSEALRLAGTKWEHASCPPSDDDLPVAVVESPTTDPKGIARE